MKFTKSIYLESLIVMYTLYVNSRTFFFKKLVISVMKGSKFLVHMDGNREKGSTIQIQPFTIKLFQEIQFLHLSILQ